MKNKIFDLICKMLLRLFPIQMYTFIQNYGDYREILNEVNNIIDYIKEVEYNPNFISIKANKESIGVIKDFAFIKNKSISDIAKFFYFKIIPNEMYNRSGTININLSEYVTKYNISREQLDAALNTLIAYGVLTKIQKENIEEYIVNANYIYKGDYIIYSAIQEKRASIIAKEPWKEKFNNITAFSFDNLFCFIISLLNERLAEKLNNDPIILWKIKTHIKNRYHV